MRWFGFNESGYSGRHFRGAAEMLDESLDGEAIPRPEAALERLETSLGHEMVIGAMKADAALREDVEAAHYLDGYYDGADMIRFGGTTEIAPSVQARIQ